MESPESVCAVPACAFAVSQPLIVEQPRIRDRDFKGTSELAADGGNFHTEQQEVLQAV